MTAPKKSDDESEVVESPEAPKAKADAAPEAKEAEEKKDENVFTAADLLSTEARNPEVVVLNDDGSVPEGAGVSLDREHLLHK